MPIPIICLDARLRQFCETFRGSLSKPQHKYLVTVLLALMLCQGTHTLSGLVHQVADGQSISGLSRFMSQSPWSAEEVAGAWTKRFHEQLAEAVEQEHERQYRQRSKRQGRPRKLLPARDLSCAEIAELLRARRNTSQKAKRWADWVAITRPVMKRV